MWIRIGIYKVRYPVRLARERYLHRMPGMQGERWKKFHISKMKELKKIQPEPKILIGAAEGDLEWMSKEIYNGKEDYGDIIRLLIHKVNELTDEVNVLKKKDNENK